MGSGVHWLNFQSFNRIHYCGDSSNPCSVSQAGAVIEGPNKGVSKDLGQLWFACQLTASGRRPRPICATRWCFLMCCVIFVVCSRQVSYRCVVIISLQVEVEDHWWFLSRMTSSCLFLCVCGGQHQPPWETVFPRPQLPCVGVEGGRQTDD